MGSRWAAAQTTRGARTTNTDTPRARAFGAARMANLEQVEQLLAQLQTMIEQVPTPSYGRVWTPIGLS